MVAAHPDDDVLGAAGLMREVPRRVRVVYVTDGSPRDASWARQAGFESREAYALARRGEALAALAVVGVAAEQAEFLGLVDQEVVEQLVPLTQRFLGWFERERPELVLTHPYEGGHPDHDATAFAVHAACRGLPGPRPVLAEFTSYHEHAGSARVHAFLDPPGRGGAATDHAATDHAATDHAATDHAPIALELSPEAQGEKARALACHRTQARVLADFGFRTEVERFRVAPSYDFARPAHERLLYEQFLPMMSGRRWLAHSQAALAALRLEAGAND